MTTGTCDTAAGTVLASGWDLGGVHLKSARLVAGANGERRLEWAIHPFEIWREPDRLAERLARLERGGPLAVTLTAELSDLFPDRSAGVRALLDAVASAVGDRFTLLNVEGRLVTAETARRAPLAVASANFIAPAAIAARAFSTGLVLDVGSTTTDIVPFDRGRPCPDGRSDRERLAAQELVYTGALRTPPAALAASVPIGGGLVATIPEHFTQMADVHVILGRITLEEYTVATPDGRGRDRAACLARLGRLVGADPGDLGDEEIRRMAAYLHDRQVERIADAVGAVARRLAPGRTASLPAVVCGAGRFLAAEACRRAGCVPRPIEQVLPGLGADWGRAAPAAALALLAAEA
ncbi:MAG TPA: hydantoinase/oxoprolinase family protein [Verrucomicrobiae bacterium]|nr:hydantoinase/oxoprolinase family protein [Verrucomicrobiae bacterium]